MAMPRPPMPPQGMSGEMPSGGPGQQGPSAGPQGPSPAAAQGQLPQSKPKQMSPSQSLLMIHQGIESLAEGLTANPGVLDDQMKQLFNQFVSSYQAFVSHLTGSQGKPPAPQAQAAPKHAVPMAQHANSGAKAAY